MKLTVLAVIAIMLSGMTWRVTHHPAKQELRTAIFAAGCFWGVQAAFDRVPGVVTTEAGYTGGTDAHPTHASVAAGHSGHVEAVRITYDPAKICYAELLDVFWTCHNPTIDLSISPGEGPGRSMIFVGNPMQAQIARQSFDELTANGVYEAPITTRIVTASTFYPAEAEHQHFADRNGGARCAATGRAIHTYVAACARRIRMAS